MKMRWLARLMFKLLVSCADRAPDVVIGDSYMLRWWLIPRRKYPINIYLHNIRHSDDDRALHDHPSWNITFCLHGHMRERRVGGTRLVKQGSIVFRRASTPHRLELEDDTHVWTLFIMGPPIREWGFHCPQGWRHWSEFTKPGEYGQIGKGCE